MKKLLLTSIVLVIGLLVLWTAPMASAQDEEESCNACETGRFLPLLGGFTSHIKAKGFPEIGFSYKPEVTATQRMVLCVPSSSDPSVFIPTPWLTGPRASIADFKAVKAMYNLNKDCFSCVEAFKAAKGCDGKTLFEAVAPSGQAPKLYLKLK